jgi:hypothetical protein
MNEKKIEQYCGHLPWANTDPRKLGTVISKFVETNDRAMNPWYEKWFTNFQFIYGNHRFQWSKQYGFPLDTDFMSRGMKSINSRSQTNISRTIFESLVSTLFGDSPDWEAIAMDENVSKNRRFKVIAEKTLSAFYAKLLMEKEVKSFVQNVVAYGVSTFKTDFDLASGSIDEIPQFQEEDVILHESIANSIDPLGLFNSIVEAKNDSGMPLSQKRIVPAKGPDGSPLVLRRWSGQPRVRTLTPFEHRRELCAGGAHHARWHQHVNVMDYDQFIQEYGALEGRTEYFDKVRPGLISNVASSFCIRHFLRMNFLTPQNDMGYWKSAETAVSNDLLKHKIVVIEHYDKPNPEMWPEGRLVVVVNGYCTHITKPQYKTNKMDGWHPFSEAIWMNINPSPMPSGPMDDVIIKNKELDNADSLIDTMMRRNMGAIYLYKDGMGFDTQAVHAEPGQMIGVNDVNGVRILKDDSPIPAVIERLREQKKDDAYEMSGATDAIRGEAQKGVSAGYAFRILEERAQKRVTHVRRSIEFAVGGCGEKLLACLRTNGKAMGADIIGYLMRNASGEFSPPDIKAFIDMPLSYGVDISVRAGSMQAKSKATMQATYLDLIQKVPSLAGRLNDADVLDRVLVEFDADVLRDKSSVHRDKARKENDILLDIAQQGPDAMLPLPVVCEKDDHAIHMAEHEAEYVKRFDELQQDEFSLQVWMMHIEMHRYYQKAQVGELPSQTMNNIREIVKIGKTNPPKSLQQIQQEGVNLQQKQAGAQQQPGAPGGQPPAGAPIEQGPGAAPAESATRSNGMGMK